MEHAGEWVVSGGKVHWLAWKTVEKRVDGRAQDEQERGVVRASGGHEGIGGCTELEVLYDLFGTMSQQCTQ